MRTRAVSSSPRAHSILLTYRCTSSVREARKPLRDNKHGQTASHLCQEFWNLRLRVFAVLSGKRFNDLVRQATDDARAYARGQHPETSANLATQGWRGMAGFLRRLQMNLAGADSSQPPRLER